MYMCNGNADCKTKRRLRVMHHQRIGIVLLLILLLSACQSSAPGRMEQLDSLLNRYETALRWGQYGYCIKAHKEPSLSPVDLEKLKFIKVTGYNVVKKGIAKDKKSAFQIVEIKYFNREYAVVKTVQAQQNWRYEKATGWKIDSPFPKIN